MLELDFTKKIPHWQFQLLLLGISWFSWMQASSMSSRIWSISFLFLMIASIGLLSESLRLLVLRLLVALLFIIFSIDKLGNLEHFADSISEYQIISEKLSYTLSGPLAVSELAASSLFLIWSLMQFFKVRFNYSVSAQYFIGIGSHIALISMLITFCGAITYGLLTNPYMDCGCGDSWNPIDILSKSIWYLCTDIKLPGLPASLFRNIISLSILTYSSYVVIHNERRVD
jgi:uncharacterized membrane protein YphA (DoxX/SURF4 family)